MGSVQSIVVNIFSLIILIIQLFCHGKTEDITHKTGKGIFIGQSESVIFDGHEKFVTRFLGIPYAKPPIKERRFSRPEPYGDFETPYNATYHRPQCMQTTGYSYLKYAEKSEDCLYLNIYIPGNIRTGVYVFKTFPVMIYLHGGGFWAGGANAYSGDILSAFNDVVVVTLNYRLSIFGFLSTGEDYSGNYGLWDMKLAIQWVHDHIHEFGGDKTKVTLFGNSAGGAAVQYQAINPDNRGLFQRIITQSGSCLSFWAIQNNPAKDFRRYISDVGCKRSEYSDIMNCLRSKSTSELMSRIWNEHQFVPSVDSDFLPEDPVSLSKRQTEKGRSAMKFFSELDLLNGVQNYDGAYTWIYRNTIGDGLSESFFDQQVVRLLNHAFKRKYNIIPNVLKKSVIYQYTDWQHQNDDLARGEKILQLQSDLTFFIPAILTSESHTTSPSSDHNNNSYFYVFSQKPDFAPLPEWLKGATHFMEIPYVFGLAKELEPQLTKDYLAPEPFTASERDTRFSKIMMKIWTNFAKTGNPNLIPLDSQEHFHFPTWPPFTSDKQKYMELSFNISLESVKDRFSSSSVAFWENVFPSLMECDASPTSASGVQFATTWFIILNMVSVYL